MFVKWVGACFVAGYSSVSLRMDKRGWLGVYKMLTVFISSLL